MSTTPIHDHSNIHQGGRIRTSTADASVSMDTGSTGGGSVTLPVAAVDVSIADAGGFFASADAEGALQETGTALATIRDVPWSYAQADGALPLWPTDCTAAFNAWVTSVTASGTRSGWFRFEPGHYKIADALLDTGAFNGQILLPNVSTSDPQITLTFEGPAHPPYEVSGSRPDPAGYAILESTLTGASGTASVISGGNGTWPTKNNICVVIRDLICVSPTNPTMTFWNRSITQGGGSDGLFITTTDWATTPTTQPTHSNSYGMKLPQWGQTNGTRESFMVGGHYTGFLQGELCDTYAIVGQCARAVEFPFSEHASKLHMQFTGCTYGIYVTGGHVASIWIDIEHYTNPPFSGAAAWLVTIDDLYDPSNLLIADIDWFSLDGVTQLPDHLFTVSGGTSARYREIGTAVGGGVTGFATPAIVLGTAAAAGAATTVIRSDATIVAFDATAPVTQAFGDTAATGSAAKAARRDHVHGMPAAPTSSAGSDHEHIANVVFSGDASTTVWELPAAPVDATAISVYVTGSRSIAWALSGALLTTLTFDSAPASAANNIVIDIEAAVS